MESIRKNEMKKKLEQIGIRATPPFTDELLILRYKHEGATSYQIAESPKSRFRIHGTSRRRVNKIFEKEKEILSILWDVDEIDEATYDEHYPTDPRLETMERRISHLENFLKEGLNPYLFENPYRNSFPPRYPQYRTIEEFAVEVARRFEIESTPSVDDLNISSRTRNALKGVRLNRVGKILEREKADLMKLRNFGQKSMDELIDSLKEKGFEW